jgi:hypothetical protein
MRAFARAWREVVQQAVGELRWDHITVLIDKLDDAKRLVAPLDGLRSAC